MNRLKFRDLSFQDIERISELVLIKDNFKVPFLKEKSINKLDLGEFFYLKYFDFFERGVNNNSFTSINNKEFYKTLYDLMNNNFSINYMNNIDSNNLELVFTNTNNKSMAYLEIDNNDNLVNFRFITPINNNVIVTNKISNLSNKTSWPFISYHEPFLLNSSELSNINNLAIDNEEKILKMMEIDFNKMLKLKDKEEIFGYANILIFNHFLLNNKRSTKKKEFK